MMMRRTKMTMISDTMSCNLSSSHLSVTTTWSSVCACPRCLPRKIDLRKFWNPNALKKTIQVVCCDSFLVLSTNLIRTNVVEISKYFCNQRILLLIGCCVWSLWMKLSYIWHYFTDLYMMIIWLCLCTRSVRRMSWCGKALCFLLAAASLHLAAGVAVMSVDLGSEWMKIAVVSVS